MFEQTFETTGPQTIHIREGLGDVVVRGVDEDQISIRLRTMGENLDLERTDEEFLLIVRDDCFISCPVGTTLIIDSVQGSFKTRGVQGQVSVATAYGSVSIDYAGAVKLGQVFGNLEIHDLGALEVDSVRGNARLRGATGSVVMQKVAGNLRVDDVDGDLQVGEVGGNAQASDVRGILSLEQVAGNLRADGLEGGLDANMVRGNVRLGPPYTAQKEYKVNTESNLRVRIPGEASLSLSLQCSGNINSQIPDLMLEGSEDEKTGVIGAGEALLEAQAGGNLALQPLGPGERVVDGIGVDFGFLDGLGATIEARIADAMSDMESQLDDSLSRIDSDALRRRVERATEQALQATERAAERARMQAEQAAERARMRAERAERRWQRASGKRHHKHQSTVTDDERMRVLRMVEQGKLTPEQAAELLAALEGR